MPTATQLVLKNSSVADAVPSAQIMCFGELAINYRDGLLYYKDTNNTIRIIASSDLVRTTTTQTITGAKTFSSGITGTTLTLTGAIAGVTSIVPNAGTLTVTGSLTVTGTITGNIPASSLTSGIIPSQVLSNSGALLTTASFNLGTTAIALNRESAAQALTGITSITLTGGGITNAGAIGAGAITATSLGLGSGGITNAGAIAGATTIAGPGNITITPTGTLNVSGILTVTGTYATNLGGALTVTGAAVINNTFTATGLAKFSYANGIGFMDAVDNISSAAASYFIKPQTLPDGVTGNPTTVYIPQIGDSDAANNILTTTGAVQTLINKTLATPVVTGTIATLTVTDLTVAGQLAMNSTAIATLYQTSIQGTLTTTQNVIFDNTAGGNPVVTYQIPSANLTSNHLVTKGYVDSIAQGLHVHPPADVILTTTNLTVAVTGAFTTAYGVATITITATSGFLSMTVDAVQIPLWTRIVLNFTEESNKRLNGIYSKITEPSSGTNVTKIILTRASDADEIADISGGDFVLIREGYTFSDCGFVQTKTSASSETLDNTTGTFKPEWVQFSQSGVVSAGTGLTKDGITLSLSTTYSIDGGTYGS